MAIIINFTFFALSGQIRFVLFSAGSTSHKTPLRHIWSERQLWFIFTSSKLISYMVAVAVVVVVAVVEPYSLHILVSFVSFFSSSLNVTLYLFKKASSSYSTAHTHTHIKKQLIVLPTIWLATEKLVDCHSFSLSPPFRM